MLRYFNATSIGYSHLKNQTVCQDFSAAYHDGERTIITACDGHGGRIYIRSNVGSKFASNAIISVFQSVDKHLFYKYTKNEIQDKLRLAILCEWNALVERSLSSKPLAKKELSALSDEEVFKVKINPAKAYGTTLNGAMVFGNKLICVNLGDGGVFTVKKGAAEPVFDESENDEQVANLTYSMCQEDAYSHLSVKIIDFNGCDGVLVCTDGLINPYQNMANFINSFVKPVTLKLFGEKYSEVDEFIKKLGTEIGTGDDVSFAVILKPTAKSGGGAEKFYEICGSS